MRPLYWLVVVSVHGLVLTGLFLSGPADVVLDAEQYWHLGARFADGDFLWRENPIAYRTPGYPAFLGAIQHLAGSRAWQVAVAGQQVCLIVTALCVAWMVAQLTRSGRWALAAYGLTAAGLVRTWYAQTLLTETLFVTLLSLHFACLLACLKRVTTGRCVAVGLTLGAAILVRPVVQFWWLPAFGLLTLCGDGTTASVRLRRSLLGLLAMGALVGPWVVRNQMVFGEPFLTQFVGRNLWIVTFQDGAAADLAFPGSNAGEELLAKTGWEQNDPRLRQTWKVAHQLRDRQLADDDVDRLMKRVCLDAIASDPARFGIAAAIRWINYWRCVTGPYPYFGGGAAAPPAGQNVWGDATLTDWETQLYDLVLQRSLRWNEFVTGCVGIATMCMIVSRDMRPFGLALLMFFSTVSGLTALVEIPTVRYRLVVEPMMVAAVCCGGACLLQRFSRAGNGGSSAVESG